MNYQLNINKLQIIFAMLVAMFLVAMPSLVQANPGGVSNNLQLWLNPSNATVTTGKITLWSDSMANGYNFVPATTDGPDFIDDYTDGTFNFNPYANFVVGENRSLTTAAVGLADTDAMTLFMVIVKLSDGQILFQTNDNVNKLTWLAAGAAQVRGEGLIIT